MWPNFKLINNIFFKTGEKWSKKQDSFKGFMDGQRVQIPGNKQWKNISNLPYAWPTSSIHKHFGEPRLYLISYLLFTG